VGAVPVQLGCEKYVIDKDFAVTKHSLLLDIKREREPEYYSPKAIQWAKDNKMWDREGAIPSEEALQKFLAFLPKEGDVYFVAYNAPFDLTLLPLWIARGNLDQALVKKRGFLKLPSDLKYYVFDPLVVLRSKLTDVPRTKGSFKLTNLYEYKVGKKLENAHTADADTRAMFELLVKVYGTEQTVFETIFASAKEWKADYSQSLFGAWAKALPVKMSEFLSKEAVFALEEAGWLTTASLVRQYMEKGTVTDLAKLSDTDAKILEAYCKYRKSRLAVKEEKKESLNSVPISNTKEEVTVVVPVFSGLKVSTRAQTNKHLFVAPKKTSNSAIKIDGCSEGFVKAFEEMHQRKPIVEDLILLVQQSGDLLKFKDAMKSYVKTTTDYYVDQTWKWLTKD